MAQALVSITPRICIKFQSFEWQNENYKEVAGQSRGAVALKNKAGGVFQLPDC